MTGDMHYYYIFQFSTYIFSADITPEMLKLCRVTKVKVFFLVLVYVFNFDLFEFSAAILEKGLFCVSIDEINTILSLEFRRKLVDLSEKNLSH